MTTNSSAPAPVPSSGSTPATSDGPRARPYEVLDVFGTGPCTGNPLAVVLDGEGLTTGQMQTYAAWTNLSETTFLLPPSSPEADYRVRIFTPGEELPFAGHPTLGSCRAWLNAGNQPAAPGLVVQECGIGLVTLEVGPATQAFQAPDLIRSGPPDEAELVPVLEALDLDRSHLVAAEWVDNGPGWLGLLVDRIETLHALKPALGAGNVGVLAFYPPAESGSAGAADEPAVAGQPRYDVRAFFLANGVALEDPVTGSLQASLAQWMLGSGRVEAPYVATQGQVMGRRGQATVSQDADGGIWVGGSAIAQIRGTVEL
jgi:PhzF family phenazine biosynthesis protein